MVRINTFVVFDMETTGLPHQERNETKATEMCFLAVSRSDLKRTPQGGTISTAKLSFMLNPSRTISSGAVALTGITNDLLKYTPCFYQKLGAINQFLQDLPKPICLVAHNGNSFDYKILNSECNDIEEGLPGDLLCVDSLPAFRQLEKHYQKQPRQEEIFTDDDDDEVDEFSKAIFNLQRQRAQPTDFKLGSVYERLYGVKFNGGHRAEGDCQMLLDCIIAYQSNNADFVKWADQNCKRLDDMGSLDRPWYRERDMY